MATNTISFKPGESNPQIDKVKDVCKNSLWFLCTQFLKYPDWDICHDDMEKLLRRPSRRKANVFPRNHLKSTFGTISVAIQNIICNSNVRILIANQVWDMSRSFLREIKEQLESSQLKYLFGDFVSAKWNEDEIIVKQRNKALKEPTIRTAGIETEQTGGHYDLIILDDLMGLNNTQTAEQREKAKRFRRSMINLLEPGGLVIENLTRWHLDDTFSEVLEKELKYYDTMVRKVVEPDKEGKLRLIFPKKFAKKFDPVRKDWIKTDDPYCMDYIDFIKASMPLDEYSAQYLNEPFSSENLLFKPEMFKYWNQRPEGLFIGVGIDLGATSKGYSDQTAMVVCGMDSKHNLYVLDYVQGKWSKPSEIVDNIFQIQSKWKPNKIVMEVNGWQRMMKSGVEMEMRVRKNYFSIDEISTGPTTNKFERIKCLEPFYRNGHVYHAAWMKGKDLENQLQVISGEGLKGKHDDLPDAFAMVLPVMCPGMLGSFNTESEWDRWVKMAQENGQRWDGFFHYGR